MTEDMEYLVTLKETKDSFDSAVGLARIHEVTDDPEKWEQDAEKDLQLLLQFSTDKLKALYNLFFVVDEFVVNYKVQLQNFRHEPPSVDALRELSHAVIEFYEEFADPEMIIEELKYRANKLKGKGKK
jgi:hypothetical protein